jgi:hypothetical protein
MDADKYEAKMYKKGFRDGIKLARASVEYVRRDGYNDIDYVLEVMDEKLTKLRGKL